MRDREVEVRIGFAKEGETLKLRIPDDQRAPWTLGETLNVVGRDRARINASDVVTGKAKYISDIAHPGMLWAKTVRSPHAHARVAAIDVSVAEKLGGVRHIEKFEGKEIRFAGGEVAIVVADSAEIAEDAARRVKVDYEVFLHAVTIEVARAPGAPQVTSRQPNVRTDERGKRVLGGAFDGAAAAIEATYVTEVQNRACLEPQAVSKTSRQKAEPSICSFLRYKQMYYVPGREDAKPECHSTCYWCVKTLFALGPDGEAADEESCRTGWSCFEA